MKHALLIIILFLAGSRATAQSLKINPGEVKQTFKVNISDPTLSVEVYSTIENTGNDTLRLRWLRRELDKPAEWLTQVCDGVECYVPIVSSNIDPALGLNSPFVLAPKKKVEFIFYVLPNQMAGTGKFALNFSSTSKPDSVLATMQFEVTVQSIVTSVRDWQLTNIQVFPNPASDYFSLNNADGVDKIVLYNVLGTPLKTFLAGPYQRYSLSGLPDGMYLVALVNDRKGIVKTIRLSKRGIRS